MFIILTILKTYAYFTASITQPDSLRQQVSNIYGQLQYFSNPPYNSVVEGRLKFYQWPSCINIDLENPEENTIAVIEYQTNNQCGISQVIGSSKCGAKCKGFIFLSFGNEIKSYWVDNTNYDQQDKFIFYTNNSDWQSLFDYQVIIYGKVSLLLQSFAKPKVDLIYSFGYYQETQIRNLLYYIKDLKTKDVDFDIVYPLIGYEKCEYYDSFKCNDDNCFQETYCVFDHNSYHNIEEFFYYIAVTHCVKELSKQTGVLEPFATFQLEVFDNCDNKFNIDCIKAAVEFVNFKMQQVHQCIGEQRLLTTVNGQTINANNPIFVKNFSQLQTLGQYQEYIIVGSLSVNNYILPSIHFSTTLNLVICENPSNATSVCTDNQECSNGCTFELLHNNLCDNICNNIECDYDLGNCRQCSPDCFEFMIQNFNCDEACNNFECMYDGDDCCLCSQTLLTNDRCDMSCNVPQCNFDEGDCIECNPDCYQYMIGDGNCDQECNVESCYYDRQDCEALCSCSQSELGNKQCNQQCNNINCQYDGGDCVQCASGCYNYMLGNLQCDSQCNNINCGYDRLDCCGCSYDQLHNDYCDQQCFNAQCRYDEGDCEQCASGCYFYLKNDGVCNQSCNNAQCQYDGGDCLCNCQDSLIGNGFCDQECYNQLCEFDGGDCQQCAPGCYLYMVDDGTCNQQCNNKQCNRDGNDCQCSCSYSRLGNDICDEECNNFECNYDDNDCACKCSNSKLNNGVCDEECNNDKCYYDQGDCICQCSDSKLGNNICDQECNNNKCNYDEGDCECECLNHLIGDGICNQECNTTNCNHDNGDCICNCSFSLLNNDICDEECNSPQCNYDQGYCKFCLCKPNVLGNGNCDEKCNTEICQFDLGDCEIKEEDESDDDDSQDSAIVNIAIGISCLQLPISIFIIILAGVILYIIKWRKSNQQREAQNANQAAPQNLQIQGVADVNLDYQNDPCSVCLDEQFVYSILIGQRIQITACQHMFHFDCLENWIQRQNNQNNVINCPNCRAIINLAN